MFSRLTFWCWRFFVKLNHSSTFSCMFFSSQSWQFVQHSSLKSLRRERRSSFVINLTDMTKLRWVCLHPQLIKLNIDSFTLGHCRKTGVNPRVLTIVSDVVSRDSTWCQTSVMVPMPKHVICSRTVSRSSPWTTSVSWKFWWCRTAFTALRLHMQSVPRNASWSVNAQSNWESALQTSTRECAHRKMSKFYSVTTNTEFYKFHQIKYI